MVVHRIMKQHLISAHEISESSPRQERLIKRQRTIEEAIIFGEKHPRKRQLIALDNSKYYTLLFPTMTGLILI